MLKVLLKKQLAEVFRSYFYDAKKNKMRSKLAIAGWFVFFFLIMVGMLGGMFTGLSLTLCNSLTQAGFGWLYFLLMSGIAVLLGAFGSVFNTYSGLYLAKDNDLLLSLPIPVRTIMAARLINIYLMGAMYSAVVLFPALIVSWAVAGATAVKVICGILLFLIVTVIVLLLSCVLGWIVAKISLKLKNKSFVTVLASVLFICAYYFFYFKANNFIKDIILNVSIYGMKIKNAAYVLYKLGSIGEGSINSAIIFTVATAIIFSLIWIVMQRSFIQIATSSGNTGKVHYAQKTIKEKSVFRALLGKEFARFSSSASYMLNCGLGILLIPAMGAFLLFKGREFCSVIDTVMVSIPSSSAILLCTVLCLLSSMNDMAAPSVSLEGKNLWIVQSLPIMPKAVLHAKVLLQLILTGLPMIFASACAAAALNASFAVKIMVCVMPLSYMAFSAILSACVGVKMPVLNWTSELAPIKQSGAVVIALFGGWGVSIAFGGIYMFIGYKIGAALYLLIWTLLFAVCGLMRLKWLNTKGADIFAAL